MPVTPNTGDSPDDFQVEEHNLQKAENKASKARGFEKFPMCLHKPGGLTKEVHDEDALQAALAQGWYADVRDVPVDDEDAVPELVSEMTPEQAAPVIAAADAKALAAIEKDELSHAKRADVLALISDAKDRLKPAKKPKK